MTAPPHAPACAGALPPLFAASLRSAAPVLKLACLDWLTVLPLATLCSAPWDVWALACGVLKLAFWAARSALRAAGLGLAWLLQFEAAQLGLRLLLLLLEGFRQAVLLSLRAIGRGAAPCANPSL